MNDQFDEGDAEAGLLVIILAIALAVYLAFHMARLIAAPTVKSDRELCVERGGEYIVLRSGPNRCFSKEAFK